MFILRIDFKTGLRVDFGFVERAPAAEALESLDVAKDGMLVLIHDDHGHEGHIRNDGVLSAVLTDLDAEVQGQMAVQQRIAALQPVPPDRFLSGDVVESPRPETQTPFST